MFGHGDPTQTTKTINPPPQVKTVKKSAPQSTYSLTVFHYPACSTCKKAIKYLKDNLQSGAALEMIDLVKTPPSKDELREYWQLSGVALKNFFNTSGESYRSGGFKDRLGSMTEDQMIDALSLDGKLIKRPIFRVSDGHGKLVAVLVGFKEEQYKETLAKYKL